MNKTVKTVALTAALFSGASLGFAQDDKIEALEAQLNALASFVESQIVQPTKTNIGGYGEIHYNNYKNAANKIDMHRFVLFINHEFSDTIHFFSELEIEHAISGAGQTGATELEQAFIQFEQSAGHITVGMFLMPVGIINETHEPTTFYGTERNPIDKYIIPTTWREGGVMYSGHSATGLSYDLAMHSGLSTTTSIRGGRQQVGNAVADTLAYTARLKYMGIQGLELSTTINYQENLDHVAAGLGAATLVEAHVVYSLDQFKFTGLLAKWTIDNGQNTQGLLLESSYRINALFGVFMRKNTWDDTGAGDKVQYDAGFNYWAHEDVVLKFDVQQQNMLAGNKDGFNLGMGYQF
ncbi:MAG: porin [Ghiorsea sp.]|nr:porin [Ghiorsea sp.]